ncbi:MAG TPA: protoheme IX farnesyltransferase [Planctomycetes bacterium]|nr:protoheme IX farnesyltransferase [Planctomycetota bacterium]
MVMNRLSDYLSMTKPRAMGAVLVTAAAGYLVAVGGAWEPLVLLDLLLGAGFAGGGSIVLNQFIERRHDLRMKRTRGRPLPAGRVTPAEALVYGIALAVLGTAWLALRVNLLTAMLGALSVVTYVLVYTPLKRISPLNTAVGAVPGALPPMMGWTAATGSLDAEAWVLFAILFIWQFPHFLAISWLHREDYARAGYAMWSGRDADGSLVARKMVTQSALLMVVSLLPVSLSMAGHGYGTGAMLLGAGLFLLTVLFRWRPTARSASWVLKGSIVHIALLMGLLVLDSVS